MCTVLTNYQFYDINYLEILNTGVPPPLSEGTINTGVPPPLSEGTINTGVPPPLSEGTINKNIRLPY